jgi:hypothetical protein
MKNKNPGNHTILPGSNAGGDEILCVPVTIHFKE